MRYLVTLFYFLLLTTLSASEAYPGNSLADTSAAGPAREDAPLRVVTSFSILENLVDELGGKHVEVVNLVGPNADAHTYRPKPSDAAALADADLVVFNGLAFEGWMSRLLANSGYMSHKLIASHGVHVITHGDEPDPHAWQSFQNIRVYVHNISDKLIELLPKHAKTFDQQRRQYLRALSALEQDLLKQISAIAVPQRIVVTSHDAFAYLGRELQIQFLAPLGLSAEVDASAADVAAVIDQIREYQVQALFVENITNPRLVHRIGSEAGIAVGGRLYSDALSEAQGPAGTYLEMMRHNVETLVRALGPVKGLAKNQPQ